MVDSCERANAVSSKTTSVTENSDNSVSEDVVGITPITSNADSNTEKLKSSRPGEVRIEEDEVGTDEEPSSGEDGKKTNDTDRESVDTLRKSGRGPSKLMQQIRYLQMKLSEIERQATESDLHDEAAETDEMEFGDGQNRHRSRKERVSASRRRAAKWVDKAEREWQRQTNDPDFQARRKRWRELGASMGWNWGEMPGQSLPLSLMERGKYRRGGLGPPTQWDTSDSEGWSDDGIRSRDFGYYEERLEGEYFWEMDRLKAQAERYQRHKAKKLDREREQSERLRQEAEETPVRDYEIRISGSATVQSQEALLPKHAISKLGRAEWSLFKSNTRVKEHESFAVDILIGEPVISYDSFSHYPFGRRRQVKSKEQKVALSTKKPSLTGQAPLPERIRIHSRQLIQILTRIHGPDISLTEDAFAQSILEKKFNPTPPPGLNEESAEADSNLTSSEEHPSQDTGTEKTARDISERLPESGEMESPPKQEVDEEDPNDDSTSLVALEHLHCLLEFIDTDISEKIAYLDNPLCAKIAFSDIWHLFKPGDEVIENNGKDQSSTKSKERPMLVRCVYVDFDGKNLGPVSKAFEIKRFEGERAITSLDIYPLRFFVPKKDDTKKSGVKNGLEEKTEAPGSVLRQQLVDRGKRFVQVAAVKHMYYSGLTLDRRDKVESQVVVDFEEAFVADGDADEDSELSRPKIEQFIGAPSDDNDDDDDDDGKRPCNAACCTGENIHDDSYVEQKRNEEYIATLMPDTRDKLPSVAVFPRSLQATRTEENALTEDELVIMSYRVFGFVLRNRTWAKLDLTYLTDVDSGETQDEERKGKAQTSPPKTAFDRLVLPEGHKKLVESLISQHFQEKENATGPDEQVDIVRGKGKGLILLLHGAPGVGKTTTAGDLGSTAREVEEALGTNFALANRWGCILFLDEADVFLAERRREDFNRNGLVAVFLRVLEFYAGIFFLTTNRIGDFDEAFASRIHISLYYPPLNRENTMEVFKLNLDLIKQRFRKKGRQIKIDEFEIGSYVMEYFDKYEKARWNGRQIRNACQTALALADYDAQGVSNESVSKPNAEIRLSQEHFKTVSDAYLEFMQYLKSVRDTYSEEWAKEVGIRALEKNIAALKAEFKGEQRKDGANQGEGGPWKQSFYSQQQQQRQQQAGFQQRAYDFGLQGHQGQPQFPLEARGHAWNNQTMMAGARYQPANDPREMPPQPQSHEQYGYPSSQQGTTSQFGFTQGATGHLQPGLFGHEELGNNL
ncbi:hypothetical protein B7463_g2239, partial [Scytalidium lignicola]